MYGVGDWAAAASMLLSAQREKRRLDLIAEKEEIGYRQRLASVGVNEKDIELLVLKRREVAALEKMAKNR